MTPVTERRTAARARALRQDGVAGQPQALLVAEFAAGAAGHARQHQVEAGHEGEQLPAGARLEAGIGRDAGPGAAGQARRQLPAVREALRLPAKRPDAGDGVERSSRLGGRRRQAALRTLRNVAAYDILTDPATRPDWVEVFCNADGSDVTEEELRRRLGARYRRR